MMRLIESVTRHPRIVIILSFIFIFILAIPLPRISVNPDLQALIRKDDPDLVRMEELEELFGSQDIVLITYATDDVFSPEALETIRSLSDEILELPYIDDIQSLTHYETIMSEDDMMAVDNIVQEIPATKAASDSLALLAIDDPLLSQILFSPNRKHTAILIFPKQDIVDELITDGLRQILAPYQARGESLMIGGMPVIRDQMSKDIARDTSWFIPLGMVLIAFLLYFSFWSRRGLMLPLLVVVLSITGTLGFMTWLNLQLTVISSIIPVMLIAVASAYGIHIIARYFEDSQEMPEADRHEIVAEGMKHLSKPIFMAALTTMIGFLALLSHILPASKEVGFLTSFGVLLAFLLSTTMVPAMLVLFPRPSEKRKSRNTSARVVPRVLAKLGSLVYIHRKLVIILYVLLAALAMSGIPRIVVDSNPLNYYYPESEIRRVNAIIDEHFGGATTMSIVVDGDIKSPDVLRQIDKIQDYMESEEIVSYTLGITDFIKLMNQAMNGGDPDYFVIPDSRELVSQYLLVYSWESSNAYLDNYVDYDYQSAQIVVRINTLAVMEMRELKVRMDEWLDENISVDNQPKGEGYAVLLGNLIPMMIKGQIRSLILSVILLALVTGLIFRSLSAAIICSMPLSFAMAVVFGLMGYFEIDLNTATSMISSIMIGIGIDYTIHFLFRFREEVRNGLDDEAAMVKSMSTTGRGIVINAVSVMIGFAVCMLSSFIPIYFFGWLIVVSIAMCLVAALTLLPVVILNFKPKFIYRPPRKV